jgi:hypothetical protein
MKNFVVGLGVISFLWILLWLVGYVSESWARRMRARHQKNPRLSVE